MRYLKYWPGLWINLFGTAALAAAVGLALLLDRLAPFFEAEWTLWAVLAVFLTGFIALVLMRRAR
jgi:hypothetical protein